MIVENNLYAVETPSNAVTGGHSIVARASGFGIAASHVDGQDVDAMFGAVTAARERAVTGHGPTLLEAETYRFSGHGSGEKASYRTREEIESWRATRDPIAILQSRLLGAGELTPAALASAEAQASARVEAAVAYAEAAQWPDPATAGEGVDNWRYQEARA